MSKPLSIGQIWLLHHMVLHDGLLYTGIETWSCPEPVGMSALRGLEKRGLCEATKISGIFSITTAGRAVERVLLRRLDEAVAIKRRKDLAAEEGRETV